MPVADGTTRALAPDVFDPQCPSRMLLDHVTSRWGVLILIALADRTMRWSEIRRLVKGITEKMLASTLRTLEADGLILRTAHPVSPPHVDYSLTDKGRDVTALLRPLVDWVTTTAAARSES